MADRDPLFIGASGGAPSYDATELRGMFEGFQPGVFGADDFKVSSGAGLTVSTRRGRAVVAPSGAGVPVFPGPYYVSSDSDGVGSELWPYGSVPANGSASPRLDAVVIQVEDAGFSGSQRRWVRRYVAGVASAGAALGGALPALPDSSLLLAEVLVPGGSPTTIPAANIRDRRPWARGAYRRIIRTSNAGGGQDYTVAPGGAATVIDATNLNPRIECSGTPLRISLRGKAHNMATGGWGVFELRMDGAAIDGGAQYDILSPNAGNAFGFNFVWDLVPPAGTHRFAPYFFGGLGTLHLQARAGTACQLVIEEIARQNAENT